METTEKQAIEKVIITYFDALNASSTAAVLPLYTEDGVFMPTNAPTATGKEELKQSYDWVFNTIQLNVKVFVEEITVSGDYAVVRTHSEGTTLIRATETTVPEENRELFVFKKTAHNWKIARYMFNKTK